jgi:hypothetical protein
LGFTWNYINQRAVSGNTVLIDYSFADSFNPPLTNDHVNKYGAGISEGFVSADFDYARGDSGSALPNGKHYRTLTFVHPQGSNNGYWTVFDEIAVGKSADTVHVAWHPGSAIYSTVSMNEEYQWTINRYSGHDVFLTIFQGTPPRSNEIKDGLLAANWGDTSFVGKYLYSTYSTDSAGRNLVTVLFPHDATHLKPTISRISGSGYTGASISFGNNTTDIAMETSAHSIVTFGGVSFEAPATLYRLQNGSVAFYFVRRGKLFVDDVEARKGIMRAHYGFISEKEISVYVRGPGGKIISPGTAVTFYHPHIAGVLLDNQSAPVLSKGDGWIKVTVGAGNHDLTFVATPK